MIHKNQFVVTDNCLDMNRELLNWTEFEQSYVFNFRNPTIWTQFIAS